MDSKVNGHLEAAALAAFEQLGFLLPDPEPPELTGPLVGVRVSFEGPTRGAVVVCGDEALLHALSMNMLGVDEPPTEALQLDALGEMANVICGNVVPETQDPTAVFRLSAPEPVGAETSADPPRDSVTLGFEGGLVRVEWMEADS